MEGTHWKLNDKDDTVIDIISGDYKMNLVETGNVYMTYPGEGIPMSYWDYAKEQNLAVLGDPYMQMDPADYITYETRDLYDQLAEMSKEYYDNIAAMTAEEFKEQAVLMKKQLEAFPLLRAKLLSKTNEKESLYVYYTNLAS